MMQERRKNGTEEVKIEGKRDGGQPRPNQRKKQKSPWGHRGERIKIKAFLISMEWSRRKGKNGRKCKTLGRKNAMPISSCHGKDCCSTNRYFH
jgi:hypothetical protein